MSERPMIEREIRFRDVLLRLYLLNAAVLITHEIDSAFWHEWELFGIPGGVQLFLGINLALVIVVLYGQQALALGSTSGVVLSWALVVGGLFAATIHGAFLLQGSQAFRNPVSLALLGATFVLSVAQAAVLVVARRRG
jgi:hypothetical protein